MRELAFFCILALTITSPVAAQSSSSNWYPSSIALPAGHQYPCALTALPLDLTGVPAEDKRYVNHIYAMLLKCVQAKVVMTDTILSENQSSAGAYSRYYADTYAALQTIMKEPVPNSGLEPFRNAVSTAIVTQMKFFDKASKERQKGTSAADVLKLPEGRQASQLLMTAWNAMQSRYPSMSQSVKDSTYHHLCALDLF